MHFTHQNPPAFTSVAFTSTYPITLVSRAARQINCLSQPRITHRFKRCIQKWWGVSDADGHCESNALLCLLVLIYWLITKHSSVPKWGRKMWPSERRRKKWFRNMLFILCMHASLYHKLIPLPFSHLQHPICRNEYGEMIKKPYLTHYSHEIWVQTSMW